MFTPKGLCRFVCCSMLLCCVMFLEACNGRSDEPCTEAELESVTDPSPFSTIVNTVMPVLDWVYPDPSCHPDHYTITIFDEDVASWPNDHISDPPVPVFEGRTVADETNFSIPPSAGLLPGETYFVDVRSHTAEGRGDHFHIWWFSTGPTCSSGSPLLPPTLLYPPDGETMYFPHTINVEWDNQMSCWPPGDFYLEISTTEDFAAPVWYGVTRHLEFIWISDGPPMFSDCTRYYWRVRADPAGGGVGPYSETRSFVLSLAESLCPYVLDEPVIPVPSIPIARLIAAANCRSGPTTEYPVLDILVEGAQLPIHGRNRAGDSWLVEDANINQSCWVHGSMVEVIGDTSLVMIIDPMPPGIVLPTETSVPPYNCAQYNANTCEVNNHPCLWTGNVCVNK